MALSTGTTDPTLLKAIFLDANEKWVLTDLTMVPCWINWVGRQGGVKYISPDAEMEKRKNIAQTQILDQKIAQITRNSRHIIIHIKRALILLLNMQNVAKRSLLILKYI